MARVLEAGVSCRAATIRSMTTTAAKPETAQSTKPPFHITKEEERELRMKAERLQPSLVIDQAATFDEYVRQLMIPPAVMDLARKATNLRLAAWQVQAIRHLLDPKASGEERLLRNILEDKLAEDASHPPYVRVACTGKGDYDHLVESVLPEEYWKLEDHGSPVVLEIWHAQHYSPIHSHGNTTGIIHCLAGQLDVMAYEKLDWNATKRGLVTLTPGQCAWLSEEQYAVHKVFCPLDGGDNPKELLNDTGDFAASFHVYLNETEVDKHATPRSPNLTRDKFEYIDEQDHSKKTFETHSDLSWGALCEAMSLVATRW